MAFNPQEQEIIKYGVSNGKSRQEVEKALFNYRNGIVKQPEQPQPTTFSDGLSRVAPIYGKNLKEQFMGGLERGAEALTTQPEALLQARQSGDKNAQEEALMRGGLRLSGGFVQSLASPITAAIQTGIQGYAELDQATGGRVAEQIKSVAQNNPEIVSSISNYVQNNPERVKDVEDLLNFVGGGLLSKGKTALKTGVKDVVTGTKEAVTSIPKPSMADDVLQSGKNLKDSIQLSIAKKNVNPQLESSAERLMKETTQNVEDPIVAYEKYLSQSKESMGDIKVDAPISTVGGKIGDAFMNVVKQRQSVGATLGEELKSVGKLRVSVAEPKSKLLAELSDSGLSYNPKTKQLTSFQGSKFAPEEVSMLNQFVKDVEALGETPTVSQIDNFIAKTRSDLSFAKGKSGVVGTTNAERIIKGNLAGLRESLNPANNGISRLSPYWKANQTYSELSDFLEEGSTFLGKKTQSGDFAKDASVAKSSVQSILNGGKKDWLIKLEGLTGYPALDDSVLALQAMKDAGDFKGLSLLQAMQETGGLPTSKAGFIQKVLDMAVERGEKLIVGTPEEQTRALLQSLKKPQTAKPTTPKTTPKASSGDKANKINQSNSGIQPNTTPTPPKGKGIRGMIDFDEIMKSLIPTKKLVAEAKDAVDELESAISFAKVAKSPQAVVDLRKALAELMTSMGKETVITNSNYKKIIQEADDMVSMLKAHIKNSEAQASNDVIERRFIKNPTTGKLEGSSKKKVVSEDTTGVPVFRGQSHEGLTAFDGTNKQRFLSGMDGTSFSLSKESAKNYGDKIVEGIVPNNTILRRKDLSEELKNFIESKVEKLSYDDYVDGTGFENVVSELARIAKGRKKNAIDLTEFFPKSKIDDEIRVLNKDGVKVKSAPKVTPLEQEAKKYKSAEEFVKAQGELVYHGTDANFTEFSLKDFGKTDEGFLGKGVYLTSDKTNAEQYGANIVESFTNLKNPYTYDAPYMFGGFNPAKIARDLGLPENASPRQITDKLKSMGHDGVVVNEITDTGVIPKAEVVVFDPKNIKTKQQLTDIWKKANKK